MWESIAQILTGPNAFIILCFLGFLAIIIWLLSKSGVLKINTNAFQLGGSDIERDIIRQQLDYCLLHLQGLEANLPKPDGYNEYLGQLIVEKIYDEFVNWVTFNHINKSEAYISLKQERIINILRQYTVKDEFRSEEFENMVRTDIKKIIEDLIKIREIYK
jgi:hypothetical protein